MYFSVEKLGISENVCWTNDLISRCSSSLYSWFMAKFPVLRHRIMLILSTELFRIDYLSSFNSIPECFLNGM